MKSKMKPLAIATVAFLAIALTYPVFHVVYGYVAEELPRAIAERPVTLLIGFLVNASLVIAFFGYSVFAIKRRARS